MVDVYIPPLRTKSGTRFGYYIQKTEEEILQEIATAKAKARKDRLAVNPVKLTPEEKEKRRREREKSPEYREYRRMMYRKRMKDPEYKRRIQDKRKAYHIKKKAEKALPAAGVTE